MILTSSRAAGVVVAVAALSLAQPAAPVSPGGSTAAGKTVEQVTQVAAATPRAWPRGRTVRPRQRRIVAISVDGLNPRALTRLGRRGAPALHRLLDQGASTLEARSAVEQTVTLPNHTGMLTSRRIATRVGHGVDVNDDPGGTVSSGAGHRVDSVFTRLRAAGAHGHLYVGKEKFALFRRSWGRGIARYVHREHSTRRLTAALRFDLVKRPQAFSFLHLAAPDVAGHDSGFMRRGYLDAVRRVDRALGGLLATLDSRPALKRRTTILLTSDHGGAGPSHVDPSKRQNYRVPFIAWGAGVARGADLYRLNPELREPGTGRPSYAARRQPVRNAAIGNLALDLLGLKPIAGSRIDRGQRLDVR